MKQEAVVVDEVVAIDFVSESSRVLNETGFTFFNGGGLENNSRRTSEASFMQAQGMSIHSNPVITNHLGEGENSL